MTDKPLIRQWACDYMRTVDDRHVVALAFPGGESVYLSLSAAHELAEKLEREFKRGEVAVAAEIDREWAQPESGGAG